MKEPPKSVLYSDVTMSKQTNNHTQKKGKKADVAVDDIAVDDAVVTDEHVEEKEKHNEQS